tara:strand:- start:310 stop:963 length:654 start_codon:yes stop_codon:yes gene_type:complete
MNNFFFKENIGIIKSLFFNKDVKNYVLDPLTCIIRCAILNFKSIGTKLSINENRIDFIDPNILQGPIRWTYGDKREDLHNIYNPILKSTQWYNTSDKSILNIFILAKKGLEKLKKSYEENSIITHSLSLYIDTLDKFILKKEIILNKNLEIQKDNQIYKELKNLWSETQINIVDNILKQMELDSENMIEWFQALDIILKSKEKNVFSIIKKNTTTLS